MQAIILAAGEAKRFNNTKKYNLKIDSTTLLENHIRVFNDNNVDPIVVTNEDILCKNNIVNDKKLGNNNGKSLLVALNSIKNEDNIIFMDADIWYEDVILDNFIKNNDDTSILVGRGDESNEESVKIYNKGKFVKYINKEKHKDKDYSYLGEPIGVVKIASKYIDVLKKEFEYNDIEWEVALNNLLQNNTIRIKYCCCFSDNWIEIDNECDFNIAKNIAKNKRIKLFVFSVDGYDYKNVSKGIKEKYMPFHEKMIIEGSCGSLNVLTKSSIQWCKFYSGNKPKATKEIRGLVDNDEYSNDEITKKLGWSELPLQDFHWNSLGVCGYKSLFINGYALNSLPSNYFKNMKGRICDVKSGKIIVKEIDGSNSEVIPLNAKKMINFSVFPYWGAFVGLSQKIKPHQTNIENVEKVMDHIATLPTVEIFEESLKSYIDVIKDLCYRYSPNLVNYYLPEFDNICHFMGFHKNTISKFHEVFDKYVCKIYEIFEPDNILILSDHGMRPLDEIVKYEKDVLNIKRRVERMDKYVFSKKYDTYVYNGAHNLWLIFQDHYYENVNMYFGRNIIKSDINQDKYTFEQNHANMLHIFGLQRKSIKKMEIFNE